MTIAYFDCFSGVAGDMILGALVDAGLPLAVLRKQLRVLPLGNYVIERVAGRREIRGTNIHVRVERGFAGSDYRRLDGLVSESRLSKPVREMARAILERLARAEARVHGVAVDRVHFHEVGAVDSVVDIVGAAVGFDHFGFESIQASPLPITRGCVRCKHGSMPVPAPATLEIIKGIPVEPAPVKEEIVTPTGAAILATVAERFGDCPLQVIRRVGYGFGDRRISGIPNALRLLIGEGFSALVVQANLDDMNPQLFDGVIDGLFAAGAVDVDLAAVQMKKNRPGIRLTALAPWERKESVIGVFLSKTTTFGVKYWPVDRRVLSRRLRAERVGRGSIRFKLGRNSDGEVVKAMPEYEDVKKLARKSKRPVADVYNEALVMAQKILRKD